MKFAKTKTSKAVPQIMPCLIYKQSEFDRVNLLENTKVLKGEKEIKTYLKCRKGKIAAMYNIVVLKDAENELFPGKYFEQGDDENVEEEDES